MKTRNAKKITSARARRTKTNFNFKGVHYADVEKDVQPNEDATFILMPEKTYTKEHPLRAAEVTVSEKASKDYLKWKAKGDVEQLRRCKDRELRESKALIDFLLDAWLSREDIYLRIKENKK